ncbi:hypothetical protein FH972_024029 [Carpinus fangiana]|uniref:Uncharacterized protein n=1 Tax=Carpinus fangiana TaxID=176857 RepID=A0A5N6KX59_9ROSI|nr:hypothetical protein FH972_024029 [Carpinus fangiana]
MSKTFLDLPLPVRKDVYTRTLNVNHPLFLFQDSTSTIKSFAPDKPKEWLALLRVNRQVGSESCAILYMENHFSLVETAQEQGLVQSFIRCIGKANSNSLSHLTMNFPSSDISPAMLENDTVTADGLRNFKLLRDNCNSLRSLELLVHPDIKSTTTAREEGHDPHLETLGQIRDILDMIPSLQRITIRAHSNSLSCQAVAQVKRFDWALILPENV